jgi:hypothetical protein
MEATSVLNNIQLTYKPSEFFYYQYSSTSLAPSTTTCNTTIMNQTCSGLSDSKFNDVSGNCLQQAICKNYSLANKVVTNQNTEQETGVRTKEQREILEKTKLYSINYIVGIIAMIIIAI